MPRTAKASVGDICYHVINRGDAQTRCHVLSVGLSGLISRFQPLNWIR